MTSNTSRKACHWPLNKPLKSSEFSTKDINELCKDADILVQFQTKAGAIYTVRSAFRENTGGIFLVVKETDEDLIAAEGLLIIQSH